MLTYAILTALLTLITGLISPIALLPNVSLPDFVTSAISQASNWIGIFNNFLPIDTLILIFGAYIGIETLLFGYKVIKWIYTKIPGVS